MRAHLLSALLSLLCVSPLLAQGQWVRHYFQSEFDSTTGLTPAAQVHEAYVARIVGNDTVRNGPYVKFFREATEAPEIEGWYTEGKKDSLWTTYYLEGMVRMKQRFKNGVPVAELLFEPPGKLKHQTVYLPLDTGAAGYWVRGEQRDEAGALLGRSLLRDGVLEGPSEFYYPGGQVQQTIRYQKGEPNGTAQVFYPNGRLQSVAQYQAGKKHGQMVTLSAEGDTVQSAEFQDDLLHGKVRQYHPGGVLKEEQHYLLGLKHGVQRSYSEEGVLLREANFEKNQLHGPYREFYPTGQPKLVQNYERGKLEGDNLKYYPTGRLEEQSSFHADHLRGEKKTFHEDGTLRSLDKFDEKGRPIGIAQRFDEKGNLIEKRENIHTAKGAHIVKVTRLNAAGTVVAKEEYTNTHESGTWVAYHDNGTPAEQTDYLAGKIHGKRLEYNPEGVLMRKENYKAGKLEGTQERYHPNGKIAEKAAYEKDKRHGDSLFYDEQGKPALREQYQRGKLIRRDQL